METKIVSYEGCDRFSLSKDKDVTAVLEPELCGEEEIQRPRHWGDVVQPDPPFWYLLHGNSFHSSPIYMYL